MWEYISPGDQSVVADGHLLEESVTGGVDGAWLHGRRRATSILGVAEG